MLLTGTLEVSFNHALKEGGMVSQLREEGTGVIPRDFSSGLGTEIGPEWKSPAGGGGSSTWWWWELTADTEVGLGLSGR